jgi:hypothetical protein
MDCLWWRLPHTDSFFPSSLAYAELYLTVAHLFRRFDLTLHDTTAATMEWDDCFTPKTKGHLKVLIKELDD